MRVGLRGALASAILLFFILNPTASSAQAVLRVLGENLQGLAGATVQNTANDELVLTDSLGELSITIDQLTRYNISHVGYETQQVSISPNQKLTVILSAQTKRLNDVQVEGFLDGSSLSRQAGSISLIKLREFSRFNETSLVNTVNTLPGIRFEERANGSYRISIRGSSIRAPFGVRNVKVYWNGIPFTEPGGNTFINLLDLANVGNVEVIKGPAGSLFGAGTGGVMKIRSTNLSGMANKIGIGTTFGSYGLKKLNASFNSLSDKQSFTLKYASQQSDGYRDHNELDRKTLEMDLVHFVQKNRTITASLLYSDLFYEIPGGLNPDQVALDPTQARPGSEAQNASVSNKLFLLKLGQEYQLSKTLTNETNVYGSFNEFTNPFNLDFKRDNQQVFGGRTVLEGQWSKLDLTVGAEYQNSFFDGKNFGNVGGQADTIRFADEIKTIASSIFAQGNLEMGDGFYLTGGFSLNSLKYDINRLVDEFTQTPQQVSQKFETVWSPRLALTKAIGENLSAHFSVSRGFSPPTTTEVRTNEGTLSLDLEPEKGTNYEFNLRGSLWNNKLSFDLAAFHFKLNETIVSNPNGDGVVLFNNAGETSQNGFELQLEAALIRSETGFLRGLTSGISFTHHNFEFRDYVKRGNEFSGNALPGTAPNTLNWRMDILLAAGFSLNVTYHYVDPIPLTDANTVSSNAYHLINTRLGYVHQGKKLNTELFFGVDNLTNTQYSLGNDLNAFGRRYFQPAPDSNYYFGLKFKFDYK